jgi:predicted NBD/HSP70 family sugar kinase
MPMEKNTKIIRKANSYLVLDAIRRNDSITIEGIIDQTGLSRPTVLSILKKLQNDEVVMANGFAATEVGRQPALYSLNSTNHLAIGIDVDGPPINLVVSGLDGGVLYSHTWDIGFNDEGELIAKSILDQILVAMEKLKVGREDILGIALGLPASIDIFKNQTVRLSRLTKWNNFPVHDYIQTQTGIKTYLRNDTHLISVAEHKFLEGVRNSLFIVHRSGVGMSIIINDQIYEGAMGNSGYIGHTTIDINGRQCDCGLKGCFETYCSKRAIIKDYLTVSGKQAAYPEILDLASKGDRTAIRVLEMAGEYFGVGISNFIRTFEIYTVIIGDIICSEDHVFFRSIVESTERSLSNYTDEKPVIIRGKLDSSNFGLGGCHFILERFFAMPKLRLGELAK